MLKKLFLVLLFVSLNDSSLLAQEDELLAPEKAFELQSSMADTDRIHVRWQIADGYYMYRDRFNFKMLSPEARLGEAIFPKGKSKEDEFLGKTEIYTGSVDIELPVELIASGTGTLELEITGQGCNEPIGVCYPPLVQTVVLALVPEAQAQESSASGFSSLSSSTQNLLQELFSSNGSGSNEFLDPDVAYVPTVTAADDSHIAVSFDIADDYYLYKDKFQFEIVSGRGQIGTLNFPPAKTKTDQYFGEMQVYYNEFALLLPVNKVDRSQPLLLQVDYQGCAEDGICYPPMNKQFTVSLLDVVSPAASAASVSGNKAGEESTVPTGFWVLILTAFVAGLALTFTPCVLPLIPILSSVIAGEGKTVTRGRAGFLALVYVLGTSLTYVGIGAVAGATGDQLQAYFQNIWAIGAISIVFVLMALSMFGVYEIQMPSAVQSRLQDKTRNLSGGRIGAILLLGAASALIVGACVSPVLISVLGVAIRSADPVLGAAIMFSMAWGMGVILIAVGFGFGAILPKAGPWMERVNQMIGVLMIAVAIYLLGFIGSVPVLLLWGAYFIVLAIYLSATQGLPASAGGWQKFSKGVGTVFLVWGILCLLGGLSGNRDVLNPLPLNTIRATLQSGAGSTDETALFRRITTQQQLQAGFSEARISKKRVMIDYYADWCLDCIRMEKNTFRHPEIRPLLEKNFVLLQVDVTDPNDEQTRAIKKQHEVFGPPATLFFQANGQELEGSRFYGYREPEEFRAMLASIL